MSLNVFSPIITASSTYYSLVNEDHKKILEEDRKLSGGPGTIVKP